MHAYVFKHTWTSPEKTKQVVTVNKILYHAIENLMLINLLTTWVVRQCTSINVHLSWSEDPLFMFLFSIPYRLYLYIISIAGSCLQSTTKHKPCHLHHWCFVIILLQATRSYQDISFIENTNSTFKFNHHTNFTNRYYLVFDIHYSLLGPAITVWLHTCRNVYIIEYLERRLAEHCCASVCITIKLNAHIKMPICVGISLEGMNTEKSVRLIVTI